MGKAAVFVTLVAVLLATVLHVTRSPAAAQSLKGIRREFAEIGERVIPATVIVRAIGRAKNITGSSGMIVTPDGYVLSDADAALLRMEQVVEGEKKTTKKIHGADAEVLLSDRRVLRAVVVRRDAETDTTLLKIVDKKLRAKLPWVPLGRSSDLRVGSFTVVVGNAFGLGREGKPALTLGVVSSLIPRRERKGGPYKTIYTSAAVNPGNNGGPVMDARGFVVGVVSSFVTDADSPYRALGIVTPIDLVRPRYEGVENYDQVFPPTDKRPARSDDAFVLESAFGIVARHARPSIVSLEVKRQGHVGVIKRTVPNRRDPSKPIHLPDIPKYPGPYSAVVLTPDGYLMTSTEALWEFDKIKEINVHLADGRVRPATIRARDRYRRVALLKIEANGLKPLPIAQPEDLKVGRFALALGNPYGPEPHAAPLLTFGIISGLHRLGDMRPWLDAVQTDAGMNDAMIGGGLVTLEGKLIGVNVLVDPGSFGRNSGIGFAVPFSSIEQTLPKLLAGETVEAGWAGIRGLRPGPNGQIVIHGVAPKSPMEEAGLKAGDILLSLDGKDVSEFPDERQILHAIWLKSPGETVVFEAKRDTVTKKLPVVLGKHPEW